MPSAHLVSPGSCHLLTSAGGLIVAEATFIAPEAGGLRGAPQICTKEQIVQWKRITDAVHAKGGYIYLQLWAHGSGHEFD